MVDSDSNGRVSLAILGQKIDHLSALLQAHIHDDHQEREDHEARLRCIENKELPTVKQRVSRVEERQGIIAGVQTVYATVLSAVAAWLGSR